MNVVKPMLIGALIVKGCTGRSPGISLNEIRQLMDFVVAKPAFLALGDALLTRTLLMCAEG